VSKAIWEKACLALDLLAADPRGLRGIVVRARAGPIRDTFIAALSRLKAPLIKLHPAMSRDALLGGVDLSQTLSSGRLVRAPGLLAQSGTFVMTMAERCPPDIAAILAAHLDSNPDMTLVLLDEGAEADECAPNVLRERLAFHVDLDGIGRLEAAPPPIRTFSAKDAKVDPKAIADLTVLAARLGIDSLRTPTLAIAAARAHAVSQERGETTDEDLAIAAELVLAPRATQMPDAPEQGETPEPERSDPQEQSQSEGLDIPDEMLVEAVRAVLPVDLMDTVQQSASRSAKGSGAGQRKKGNRRGRPLPSRPGRLDGQARLDLVATLRAAAPWRSLVQTKRRLAGLPGGGGTPLAAGLKAAGELALNAQSQGLSPMLALLTDGRANIALDGSGNRTQAGADATKMATWLRAEGLPAVVLDLGTRPQPVLAELSNTLGGRYLPLPRADAHRMSEALGAAMQDGLGA